MLIAVLASALLRMFIEINIRIDAAIPWFVVPAAAIAICTLIWSERLAKPVTEVRLPSVPVAALVSVGAAAAMVLIGLALTDHSSLTHGLILLPGDRDGAPRLFRFLHSIVALGCAGLIEEGSIRNVVQLRLQHAVKPIVAEAVSDLIFVLLHADQWQTQGELPFVATVALVNGRLAALTQTARYPALVHSVLNIAIAIVILLFRPQS